MSNASYYREKIRKLEAELTAAREEIGTLHNTVKSLATSTPEAMKLKRQNEMTFELLEKLTIEMTAKLRKKNISRSEEYFRKSAEVIDQMRIDEGPDMIEEGDK